MMFLVAFFFLFCFFFSFQGHAEGFTILDILINFYYLFEINALCLCVKHTAVTCLFILKQCVRKAGKISRTKFVIGENQLSKAAL